MATFSLPLCTISIARDALLAQLAHMRLGQRGVAAVDVADDVGVGLQHHVLVDQPEPGIDGPPVWIVLWMPYLRAQATISLAS
jgi:hypothetical protein